MENAPAFVKVRAYECLVDGILEAGILLLKFDDLTLQVIDSSIVVIVIVRVVIATLLGIALLAITL